MNFSLDKLSTALNRLHVAVIFLTCITLPLAAQGIREVKVIPDVEKAFQEAMSDYRANRLQEARKRLAVLVDSPVIHQRKTSALILMSQTMYRQSRYEESLSHAQTLIGKYPRSQYVDDAHYVRGKAYYRLGQNVEAARELLWLVDWSANVELVKNGARLANHLVRRRLTRMELRALHQQVNGPTSSGLTTIALAQRELDAGDSERVMALVNTYRDRYGSNRFSDELDRLYKSAEGSDMRPTRVGVILPLSGEFSEQGLGILRGVRFAQSESGSNGGAPTQVYVRDSEGSMIRAIKHVKQLINEEQVEVIIGELTSEATAAIGAIASLEGVPMISPAATENEVASVGNVLFQLNSDLERKGVALAEYAFDTLGMQTFATLSPADDYGQQLTASFASRIDALGGRIIAQSWYYGEAQDVSRQFDAIRESAFVYDSTDVQTLIDEAEEVGEDLEPIEIPVTSIDGLFLPIYAEDIPYVAPQFARSNIRSQILGGEYWDDLETLTEKQVKRYIDGVIFISDYFPDEGSRRYRDFRTSFRLQMKRSPERWEVFGYDSFRLIASAIGADARTSSEIGKHLATVTGYAGVKGEITFLGNNRVNSEVNFLQFVDDEIVKHQVSENKEESQ